MQMCGNKMKNGEENYIKNMGKGIGWMEDGQQEKG